jgi:hypothetical protein
MCALTHVTSSCDFQELWLNRLKDRMAKAKSAPDKQDALVDHIEEITTFAEYESRMIFRMANLMTPQQLHAYDKIAEKLGKGATNKRWNAAIKEWKQKQPRHE